MVSKGECNIVVKKNKIKVCHIVCGLKSGGVETMIYNYCSKLNKDLFEWHMIYQHEPTEKNVKEFENIGFKLHRITSKVKNPIKNFIETYQYFKENEINVVHCHMTLMNFIPLIAAKILNISIRICHSHNNDVRKKYKLTIFVENIFKKLCKKYATHFIACGKDAGVYLYEKENFSVLYNAMDIDKFRFNMKSREKIRKKYNVKDDEILIGHIGRFTIQKNHLFLLDIYKKISNKKYKLILIGDGELQEKTKEYAKNLNLTNDVIFTGILENTQEMYSAFDVFVLPSIWEGLPVVAIEAQASGVPCLLSQNIDADVIINNNVSTLELDIDKWHKKILEIDKFNREINMEEFQKRGFDIKHELDRLESLYKGEVDEKKC